jgi:hypothetical protein
MSKRKNRKRNQQNCGIIEVVNRTTRTITLLNPGAEDADTAILPRPNKEN